MNYSWILDNQINLKQPSHSIEDQNVARFEEFKTLTNFDFFFSIRPFTNELWNTVRKD